MRSLLVGTGLLLASGLGLVVCGGTERGAPADAGATLSDGTIESAADDGAGFDGAPPCNPPCANGLACTEGICMGCTGPSVILAEATGDPNVAGFGSNVAISGSTLLVGAQSADNHAGAVYVFTRSGSAWSYVTTLPRPAGVTGLGLQVVMSGAVAMVSAKQGGAPAPVVLVYDQTGSTWTLSQVITPPPPPDGGDPAYEAALAIDGTTAIVLWGMRPPPTAIVYVKSGSSWVPQATLTAPEIPSGASTASASSVALSGDTALLGLQGGWMTAEPAYTPWVDVFVRSGTTWMQQASLAPQWNNQTMLGSVGIAHDMAAFTESDDGVVYVRSGTTWTQQTAKGPGPDGGGTSAGNFTPPYPSPLVVSPGSLLVGSELLALTSTSWQPVTLPPFDAGGGNLSVGASVARSGSTVVIGAPGSASLAPKGAVLVYSCSP